MVAEVGRVDRAVVQTWTPDGPDPAPALAPHRDAEARARRPRGLRRLRPVGPARLGDVRGLDLARGAAFGVPQGGGFAALAWVFDQSHRHDALAVHTSPRFRRLGLGRAAASALIAHSCATGASSPSGRPPPRTPPPSAWPARWGCPSAPSRVLLRWPPRRESRSGTPHARIPHRTRPGRPEGPGGRPGGGRPSARHRACWRPGRGSSAIDPSAEASRVPAGVSVVAEPYEPAHLRGVCWPSRRRPPRSIAGSSPTPGRPGIWVNSAGEPEAGDFTHPGDPPRRPLDPERLDRRREPRPGRPAPRSRGRRRSAPPPPAMAALLAELRPLVLAKVVDVEARARSWPPGPIRAWLDLWAAEGPEAVRRRLLEMLG